jgi:heme A synthase
MAATKSQGSALLLFLVGITTACAGLAYFSSGSGKLAFFVGAVVLIASLAMCLKIKPDEGKVAAKSQPVVLQLVGVGVVLLGWFTVLYGLHLTASVSGRMTTSIIGFAISLVGVIYFLPAASSKNAIWK